MCENVRIKQRCGKRIQSGRERWIRSRMVQCDECFCKDGRVFVCVCVRERAMEANAQREWSGGHVRKSKEIMSK